MTLLTEAQQLAYANAQAADGRINVELETDDGMVLNMGPQHPATHGTLRLVARLDGEQVISADVMCGYMHRGYEKLVRGPHLPAGHDARQPHRLARQLRQRGAVHPRRRAAHGGRGAARGPQWIRTILFELSRIANITLFVGDLALQLGAQTPAFFAFRDREYVLNQIESVTGGRFHPNFDRIGGLKDDLPKGWIAETKAAMGRSASSATRWTPSSTATRSSRPAPAASASIPAHVAQSYGLSGANLRGSGVDWDLRRDANLGLAYDQLDWKVWTHPDGDSFARSWVRLQEVREATTIVDQLLDGLPGGPIMAKVPRIIKVPEGEAYVATENPLGEMGYYVVSKGDTGPFRVKIRSASFNNISILPWLLRGVYVPDIIAILASLYFILGDIDR